MNISEQSAYLTYQNPIRQVIWKMLVPLMEFILQASIFKLEINIRHLSMLIVLLYLVRFSLVNSKPVYFFRTGLCIYIVIMDTNSM